MKLTEIKDYAAQLEANDTQRNEMYRAMDEMYLCVDSDLPSAEWIKPTVSPDARNAVDGAKRLLTAADPKFSVPIERNKGEISKKASGLERAANSMWINAGIVSGKPRHYDLALSALMYSEIQMTVISTKRLADTMQGKQKARWEKIARRAPVLFDHTNPREGHSSWGLGGLDAYYSKRIQNVGQVQSRFGDKVLVGKAYSAPVTVHEFWNLDQHVIWTTEEDAPLMEEENPWPFIPVVSVMVEGSMLFQVDATYQTRQPFLYAVWKTSIWKRQNLYMTLMCSLAFEVGANPMLVFESVSEDNPVIDYEHPGGMIKIKQNEKLYPLVQKVISNDLVQQAQMVDDRFTQSTLYRQVLGEPIGSNAPYSMTALLSQAGRLPLTMYQRMGSFAITQGIQMAFEMVRTDGGTVTAANKTGLEEIKASDIPDEFNIEAKLDISMPQDDRLNAQVAAQLTNPQHPLVSDRYALEEYLHIGQPDEMQQEIQEEQYVRMYAQMDLQAEAQKKQMEMQAQMQQAQPQLPPGGQPSPEEMAMMQQGPPPDMGDPGMQGVQPGLPMGAPMEPMGSPMGPGGMPPEDMGNEPL